MSRKVSIRVLLMSLVYLHHLVLRSPVASFATMPKPSAAILENQCRGPAAAARTQTHRNFRDQESGHTFSFWWILSFNTPPAYATSFKHSCMSLRFFPNLLFQIVSFTIKSLEILDMQQTFHQHVSFVLIASLFLFLNTEMLSSDSCSRQCLHQRGCYQRNLWSGT